MTIVMRRYQHFMTLAITEPEDSYTFSHVKKIIFISEDFKKMRFFSRFRFHPHLLIKKQLHFDAILITL